MTVRKRIIYSGCVQGVGFRYTAQNVARDFAVAGHVRNLTDGTVELVAEGAAEQVEAFLNAVAEQMADNIRRIDVHQEAAAGCSGFEVRR